MKIDSVHIVTDYRLPPLLKCALLGRTEKRSLYFAKKGSKQIMPLLQVLMVLVAVGVLLWLVNGFIPMAGSIKSILNAVVVIVVVLWLMNIFGILHSLSRLHVS
jgi:hypothetical protein